MAIRWSSREPCPFCGTQQPTVSFIGGGVAIDCHGCGVSAVFVVATKVMAIELWNKRAQGRAQSKKEQQ